MLSDTNRSGSNFSGSGKYLGSICKATVTMMHVVPFGMVTSAVNKRYFYYNIETIIPE